MLRIVPWRSGPPAKRGKFMATRWLPFCLFTAAMLTALPAPADDPPPAARTEETAKALLTTWTQQGQAACEARSPACQGMDRVLSQAATAFEAAHRLDKAIAVRTILVDP